MRRKRKSHVHMVVQMPASALICLLCREMAGQLEGLQDAGSQQLKLSGILIRQMALTVPCCYAGDDAVRQGCGLKLIQLVILHATCSISIRNAWQSTAQMQAVLLHLHVPHHSCSCSRQKSARLEHGVKQLMMSITWTGFMVEQHCTCTSTCMQPHIELDKQIWHLRSASCNMTCLQISVALPKKELQMVPT